MCTGVRDRLVRCERDGQLPGLSWNDLGARGPINFVSECRAQWDRERLYLSAPELRRALQACSDAQKQLDDLTCRELLDLYGPSE